MSLHIGFDPDDQAFPDSKNAGLTKFEYLVSKQDGSDFDSLNDDIKEMITGLKPPKVIDPPRMTKAVVNSKGIEYSFQGKTITENEFDAANLKFKEYRKDLFNYNQLGQQKLKVYRAIILIKSLKTMR